MFGGKPCMFYVVPNARLGVDVVFFDYPENLPMPRLFSLPNEVPK